jgi:nitrogen fixation/metabolism regulation signal transduction histidine kinase
MKSNSLTEKDSSFVEMIHKSSVHLEDLANNYKKYMKSSVVTMKKADMGSIIQESIELTQGILHAQNVKIEFMNGFDVLTAYVNKTNIEQVFVNLIKNSVEAFPMNQENKKITIITELDEEAILIHFKDTGKGIAEENWESIFDPFMSFKEKGMGLGMPFVKKTLIEHMGNIHIEESSAKGTHFKIEIPKSGLLNMK